MVEGVISRTNAKQWNGKTFYSFALNGQEGWYNLGMKRPPAEGTSVRFEFKVNGKGYKDVDGPIEIRTDGDAAPTGTVGQVAQSSSRSGKSAEEKGFWERKEGREVRNDELRELGATRNTAIAIIDLMIKHEAIKLPAVAKREGFLWDVLNRYVDKLRGKEKESTGTEKDQVPESTPEVSNDPQSDGWN